MNIIIDPDRLKPKTPKFETTWCLWQKSNLNIHRGILEYSVDTEIKSLDDLFLRIRKGVKKEFKPGWLRGFGFGTILHFKTVPDDLREICYQIDTKNKKDGVWQWAVVIFDEHKAAIGVHTWLHGYLRPVYDSILQQLVKNEYKCVSFDRQKGSCERGSTERDMSLCLQFSNS